MSLSRVDRHLLRHLLKLAKTFDNTPLLKALVCRNHGTPLPEPLDSLVARFLGGADYYWPPPPAAALAPAGQLGLEPDPEQQQRRRPQRVAQVVADAFRNPPAGGSHDVAFAGIRYLSAVLAVARKHQLLANASAAAAAAAAESGPAAAAAGPEPAEEAETAQRRRAEVRQAAAAGQAAAAVAGGGAGGAQLAAAPERGVVLVAHPALGSIFSRSVVLLCRHEPHQGSYGLILNKPLGSSLRHLHERLAQLRGGAAPWAGLSGFGAGFGAGGSGSVSHLSGSGPAGPGLPGPPAAGAEGEAGGAAAPADSGEVSDGDVAADRLQGLVDFLAWKQQLRGAAAAASGQLEQQQDEYDEYGNWMDPAAAYQEPESEGDGELAGSGGEEVGDDEQDVTEVYYESEEDLQRFAEQAAGALVAAAAGGDGTAALGRLLDALQRASRDSAGAFGMGLFREGDDTEGVTSALEAALKRSGGGSVVMVGPEGQLFTRHLPPGDYSSEDDEDLASSSSSSDEEWEQGMAALGGYDAAEERPAAIAESVLRCLRPDDRRLLQRQAAAQRRQAVAQLEAELSSSSGGSSGLGSSSASSGSGSGATAARVPSSKALRWRQAVEQLVASATSAQQAQQQQLLQQEQQAGGPTAASLFGTPGAPSASRGGSEGAAAAAGSGGAGSDECGSGGGEAGVTLGSLMGLFQDSPLFRGGPVPGVQVLHRRPRLGGHLVLPPWGGRPTGAQSESELAAAEHAATDAAAAWQPSLEGGLVVGADLARAQALALEGYLQPGDVRVCVGDCGWAAGQLDAEVARGSWAALRTAPAFLDLFGPAAAAASQLPAAKEGSGGAAEAAAGAEYEQGMWAKCLGALGPEYAELARVPRCAWADLAELGI